MAMTADKPPRWDTPRSPRPTPSRRSPRVRYATTAIAAAIVLAVVVAGFTLNHHSKSARGDTPDVTSARTVTTAPNAASTTATTAARGGPAAIPADQSNPPSLAGAYTPDPIVVMRAISAYSDWLFAHPNPALLADYMLSTCSQYDAVKAELTTMVTNGWHARPSVSEIEWVKVNVPFRPAPGLLDGHPAYVGGGVKAVMTYTPQSSDILNATGQVVTSAHNPQLLMLDINFAQGHDGQFRIISEGVFNPPGGVAAFES